LTTEITTVTVPLFVIRRTRSPNGNRPNRTFEQPFAFVHLWRTSARGPTEHQPECLVHDSVPADAKDTSHVAGVRSVELHLYKTTASQPQMLSASHRAYFHPDGAVSKIHKRDASATDNGRNGSFESLTFPIRRIPHLDVPYTS
jgi:hypothetical protein